MKHLDLTQATDSLATYIQKLEEDQLVVVQHGKPVAVLMPITEDELEDISLSNNPEFLAILEKSRTSLQRKGGVSLEQVKQGLGLA
ncbi:MAG: type II toxin-antitoxin system Phd/YefM family antitoxin [Symploca sp. SIO2E6]|nr:type II toxin-antitoxin system Phd/YefM family antitoxin [Symploca sp. SIO2E6]